MPQEPNQLATRQESPASCLPFFDGDPRTESWSRNWPVPFDVYQADTTAVSASMIKDFILEEEDGGPELYFGRHVSPIPLFPKKPHKTYFDIGNAFEQMVGLGGPHCLKLIPPGVLTAKGAKSGKAWDQFKQENQGKLLLKPDEYAMIGMMVTSCMANPMARVILSDLEGAWQFKIRWKEAEFPFARKACLDRLCLQPVNYRLIADIKTDTSVHQQHLQRKFERLGYDIQQVWYQDAVAAYLDEDLPFCFVVVKKSPPYSCRIVELESDYIKAVEKELAVHLQNLSECYATGDWSHHAAKRTIRLPKPYWR